MDWIKLRRFACPLLHRGTWPARGGGHSIKLTRNRVPPAGDTWNCTSRRTGRQPAAGGRPTARNCTCTVASDSHHPHQASVLPAGTATVASDSSHRRQRPSDRPSLHRRVDSLSRSIRPRPPELQPSRGISSSHHAPSYRPNLQPSASDSAHPHRPHAQPVWVSRLAGLVVLPVRTALMRAGVRRSAFVAGPGRTTTVRSFSGLGPGFLYRCGIDDECVPQVPAAAAAS